MNSIADNEASAWSRIKAIQAPWAWSFIGAVLVWLAIVAIFGFGIASNVAQTALTYGVFMVLLLGSSGTTHRTRGRLARLPQPRPI